MSADLAELKLGSLTLTPAFDADETEYTAETTNATNKLTATPVSETAEVTVELNGTEVEAGDDGKYTLTWETGEGDGENAEEGEGENTVEISVVDGDKSKTYTITVTAS